MTDPHTCQIASLIDPDGQQQDHDTAEKQVLERKKLTQYDANSHMQDVDIERHGFTKPFVVEVCPWRGETEEEQQEQLDNYYADCYGGWEEITEEEYLENT